MIESLQQEGLDLNTIGNVQTTIEEVQQQLELLGQSEIASSLRQHLDIGKHLKFKASEFRNYPDTINCTSRAQLREVIQGRI